MSVPLPIGQHPWEPVSLYQAQQHLRLDVIGDEQTHPDNDLVESLITAAREHAEHYTGTAIARQQYRLTLDAFPSGDYISLGTWPVTSIDSVTYTDADGQAQTMSQGDMQLVQHTKPARLALAYGARWPVARAQPGAVVVTFTAGRTDGESPNDYPVPQAVIRAMLLTIGHLYEHREAVTIKDAGAELPMGVLALLTQHRIDMGMR